MVLLMWIVTIVLIYIISCVVMLVVDFLFWDTKETYEVIDIKDYSYIQQITIKDESNNIYLMPVNNGQQYQVGNEIKLSRVDVKLNGCKIN